MNRTAKWRRHCGADRAKPQPGPNKWRDYTFGGFPADEYDEIVDYLLSQKLPVFDQSLKNPLGNFHKTCRKFKMEKRSGKLMYLGESSRQDTEKPREVIKEGDVRGIVVAVHRGNGHCGSKGTRRNVRNRYYWPGTMTADCDCVVQTCTPCQQSSAMKKGEPEKLKPLAPPKPTNALKKWIVDLTVMPKSPKGYDRLFVAKEPLLKLTVAYAMRGATSQSAAWCLEKLAGTYGLPSCLGLDNGAEFK
jgi:hypothetical protein